MPQTKIAKKYNCSIRTIRTHINHYNLGELLPKYHWQNSRCKKPNKDYLKELIWNMPTTKIAKLYNVSDKAVEKWCKKYEISKPPRGYWAKQKSHK